MTSNTTPASASSSTPRRSNVLTLVMLACLVYFLLPLFWLVVSATKDNGSLFSTFGLWFGGGFHLFGNLHDVFTYDGGIYGRWLLNTALYAGVSAVGSALLATLGSCSSATGRADSPQAPSRTESEVRCASGSSRRNAPALRPACVPRVARTTAGASPSRTRQPLSRGTSAVVEHGSCPGPSLS